LRVWSVWPAFCTRTREFPEQFDKFEIAWLHGRGRGVARLLSTYTAVPVSSFIDESYADLTPEPWHLGCSRSARNAETLQAGIRLRVGGTCQEVSVAKEDRGFASMDRSKQREIASKGGKAAHQKGTADEWTSEEAREAGRKGGLASHQRRKQQSGDQGSGEMDAVDTGRSGEQNDQMP
jgi:general stress protein YciG